MFFVQDLNLIIQFFLQYKKYILNVFKLRVLFEGYISSIHICTSKKIVDIYVGSTRRHLHNLR
jgi:hypothetical protein